jgi:molecular chaperone DnaK
VKEAEDLLKDKDAAKEALEAKAEALGKAAQKLGEVMYADAQAKAQGAGGGGGNEAKKDEKVVDAEYTEVNDKK